MVASWDAPAPDFLKLTSGTTSAPRAVRFRAQQLVADCEQICDTMGITAADLNFGVIPFSHSYGFSNLLTPLICRGVPLVASDDRMPRAILNALSATRATVFAGMPVFFEKLAAIETARPLPALRLCISAGAPLPAAVAQRFTKRFGAKIHTFYGSSECGGIGYDASPSTLYEEGYVGTPMCRVTVESSVEEVGPIEVRSAAVADGYFPDPLPEALSDGRFVPGDLLRWNERGMYLVGRASELINIAGRKLNPLEVESRIQEFPGIRQAVVFGIPSPLRGEEPIACVAGEGLNSAEVLRFCQTQLSSWQVPKDVWLVAEIPTNERGKISRRELAESYLTRAGRTAAK
jgi:long-chain acyl-CoA synthetase